ncbi:MAG: DNA translocase FtsK [bacterium]
MKQAKKKKPQKPPIGANISRGIREAALIILGAIALFLFIALVSYNVADPGWTHTGNGLKVRNLGGSVGAWFADIFYYLLGYLAMLAPVMVAWSGWLVFKGDKDSGVLDLRVLWVRWGGFFLVLLTGCGLASLHFSGANMPLDAGGLLGQASGKLLVRSFGEIGGTLLLLAGLMGGMTLFTGVSWIQVVDYTGEKTLLAIDWVHNQVLQWLDKYQMHRMQQKRAKVVESEHQKQKKRKKVRIEPKVIKTEISARPQREKQIPLFKEPGNESLPTLDLLDPPGEQVKGYSKADLEALSRQVELKLKDFKVDAEVESVHPGPVVTRFELMLAPGTKVSKITGLAKDIARALSVMSVRVVEVIPGKSTIGLEIPNTERELVVLSEILSSRAFEEKSSPLTMGLGKDVSGNPVVSDLAKMPHLLVAGTTGSGKSVGVNAMLISLLFKATPDQVRLIMIDPKMLELSVYADIPHLLTPVVTDMKDAGNSLRWCVMEMERRYKLMSLLGVRGIAGYNKKVQEAADKGEPILDPLWKPNGLIEDETAPELEPLPFIVVVVDEFADMMMVVGKKVEELIARLAQKARAAGIHLILATQRPSVDVITGLIKANIPSRMAFQVSSRIDSRTILDQMGAEMLLGHGDMLFLAPGTSMTERVHGAFVSDHEVHAVAEMLRSQGEPDYLPEILEGPESSGDDMGGFGGQEGDSEGDAMYDQAVAVVTESRKASISYVQRRLKVGYNRAARMIEQMEADGVVTEAGSSGQRQVLAPAPPRD